MIDAAIVSVVGELNDFLRTKFRLKDDRAVIANLMSQDGSPAVKEENRIIVTLINIGEEKLAMPKYHSAATMPKPVYLNLYILFSASFNPGLNVEALKFISAVIAFFQSKPVFDPQNTPMLDPAIEKMVFDIYTLSLQEQSNMWASVGAKAMPSIMYKAHVISISESLMKYEIPAIEGLDRSPQAS